MNSRLAESTQFAQHDLSEGTFLDPLVHVRVESAEHDRNSMIQPIGLFTPITGVHEPARLCVII